MVFIRSGAACMQYNYFSYVVSGVLATVDNFNNNLIENAVTSADGDHCNLMFIFGPAAGQHSTSTTTLSARSICSGGVNFWLNGNQNGSSSWVTNAYNNIIDASPASGNVFNIGGHPSSGDTGTYNIYNTTVIAENGGTCMGNGEASPRSTTNFSNLHCIGGSKLCDGTGTTCNNQGGNLLQPASTASSQGYTASEVFEYSPESSCTPGTCSTVQAGVNLSSSCSGSNTALCNSITYPMYDSTNHTMSMNTSAPAGNSRGSTWDIGAYEFGGAGSAPNPPTGLSAVVN